MPIPGTWDDPKKKLTDDPGALPQAGTNNPAIVISGISVDGFVNIGGSFSCHVNWVTSQASSSRVQFGVSPNLDQTTAETQLGAGGVTSHQVTISGVRGLLYIFRVHSRLSGGKDGMGNSVQDGYDFHADGAFVRP